MAVTGDSVEVAVDGVVPVVVGAAMEMTTAQVAVAMEVAETTIATVAGVTAMAMITTVAEILALRGIAVARQLVVAAPGTMEVQRDLATARVDQVAITNEG